MPRRSRAKIRLALHNSAYTEHVPATITSWQLELFVIAGCARSQQGIQSIIPLSALAVDYAEVSPSVGLSSCNLGERDAHDGNQQCPVCALVNHLIYASLSIHEQ